MELSYECDLLDDFVLKRLKRGLHTHVLITGLQGKGKSDYGIRMGERLSAKIKNDVEFSHTDIVDSLIKLLDRLLKIKKPGEIIVLEEASVLFPSRRAMTSDNVAIGRILDTIRKKEAILISNAPLYPSIDSHMRAMAEVLIECQKVMKKDKLVKAKAWILQTSPHSGKTYRHTFRRGNKKVMFHYAKQSNPDIRAEYEREKDRFILNLLEKLKDKAKNKEMKENGIKGNISSGKEKRDREIWYRRIQKRQPIKRISKDFGLSERQIERIIKQCKENSDFPLEKPENMTDNPQTSPYNLTHLRK